MPTLGNTAKPTSTIEAWSGGTYEIMAQLLTMPSGGPWLITDVGVWAAGYAGVNVTARVCVWTSAGTLLSSSANFTLTGQAFANGNISSWQRSVTNIQVNGGQQVYVGLQVANNGGYQFGRYASGTHQDRKNVGGALPSSFGSGGSHSPAGSAWLVYQTANQAPNAPTGLSPSGNTIVHSGTAPTVSGTRSDPDAGDYITAYQVQVYRDNGATLVHDTGGVAVGGTPTTFNRQVSLPNSHEFFRWRARTRDKGNLWGPYSALQRFKANSVPSTPGGPTISSSAVLSPTISGNFVDSGDTLAAVQIQVEQPANTSRWSTGDIAKSGSSGAGWSQAYGGSALAWGTVARARYRTKDSHGAYSAWGSWTSWTPTQPAGPESLDPSGTNPRLASLTPSLTVGHSANFVNDEMEVRTAAGGGTQLWLKAWNASDYSSRVEQIRTYVGTALAHGGVYYWRARVRLASTLTATEWSDWMPFRINAVPNAPTGMTPTGGIVLASRAPTLRSTFSDPDTDQGDSPSAVDVTVRDNNTDALMWEQTGATPYNDGAGADHATPAREVITNRGFEVNITGWNTASSTITRDTSIARTGVASGRMQPIAGNTSYSGALWTHVISGATAGRTFLGRMWIYAPPGSPAIGQPGRLFLRESGGGTGNADTITIQNIVEGWNLFEVERTLAQNDRTSVILFFNRAVGVTDPEQLWVDDASLAHALPWEETYKWRSRFTDEHGLVGPWSTWRVFKVSQPPSAALVAPANEAVVELSTPEFEWSFSSPGGKAQYSYIVRVFDRGPTADPFADEVKVYDSGEHIGAAQSLRMPFGILANDRDYRWEVEVRDTDGLTYILE